MVSVSYQLLGLYPATSDDDPDQAMDWKSGRLSVERTFLDIPGSLVIPLNPKLTDAGSRYLFDSQSLVAFAATLAEPLSTDAQLRKLVPKISPLTDYPYRKAGGRCCLALSVLLTLTIH